MSRFLLSALSIFVLVASAFLVPGSALAKRCPVRDPSTLLSLYRNSEFIYIGTYDKTEDLAPTEETEEYTVVPIKKHFTISTALKGESRKFVVLDDTEYRYKEREAVTTEEESEVGDGEEVEPAESDEGSDHSKGAEEAVESVEFVNGLPNRSAKPGDTVLLFLDRATEDDEDSAAVSIDAVKKTSTNRNDVETNDRLELSDDPFGIKNLTPDALSAYETRIKELNSIFASKEPTHSEIVAWMIRCAEDPLTRWEGTFELLQSFQRLEWQEERAKEIKEEGQEETTYTFSPPKFHTGDPGFAKVLSDAQKQALTEILMNRGKSAERETAARSSGDILGDRELVDLVGRWGDSAVAANLIEQLQHEPDADFSSELMTTISSILDDDELSSISQRYSEIQWEDGEAVVESETEQDEVKESNAMPDEQQAAVQANDVELAETGDETSSDSEEAEAEADETNTEVADVPNVVSKKQTYAEARAELLKQFKSRASTLLTKERNGKTAKLNP